jgi:hypothetical protein
MTPITERQGRDSETTTMPQRGGIGHSGIATRFAKPAGWLRRKAKKMRDPGKMLAIQVQRSQNSWTFGCPPTNQRHVG